MRETREKVLIVGQGLAGTLLAFRLWKNQVPFVVHDLKKGATSSAIAAGLINPIVVKHFGLSWMAEKFIPEAFSFYSYLEEQIKKPFFYPLNIVRIFHNHEQNQLWQKNSKVQTLASFMGPTIKELPNTVIAPYGAGLIKQAARIDTEAFIALSRDFFKHNQVLVSGNFNYDQLQLKDKLWFYKGVPYTHVIFCEGTEIDKNPWFGKLPVTPAKGQLVKISNPLLTEDFGLSRKIFILPQGNQTFKIGATWERSSEHTTTPEAAEYLESKFFELINNTGDFKVIDHYFGFRPTIPDRKPILGEHPIYKGLFVFNGLGSKGYMVTPWLTDHFYEHIFQGIDLIPEVSVEKYHTTLAHS